MMMNNMIEEVNERLKEILSQYRPGLVKEAMTYSLMAAVYLLIAVGVVVWNITRDRKSVV